MRQLELDDIPAVLSIEKGSFSNPWNEEDFLLAIVNLNYEAIVAELDGLVGYAVSWFSKEEMHIGNLAVAKAYRRRGIGSALLSHILDLAKQRNIIRATLEVRVSNEAARRLYLAHGFFETGVRKGYYENPHEDALVMVKFLG
ncbi:MAG TPA: ribosomal-protein-alanine N-acetyltransferase [Candidatus Latescibacteria bacterium]|nr:ribosomal-protein-alanine N-acetyltransferase [Candidatus Latescibacterota bacterium]